MRDKGNKAENEAIKYLMKNDFDIIEHNFYSRFGEIDIIAIKEDILHFIEVKSGKNFDPVYNITPTKIQKLLKTIDYFFLTKKLDFDYVLDAIIIRDGDIEFLENITI